MKVLHLITGLNVGGAEVMLAELVKGFAKEGDDEFVVVSLTDIGEIGKRLQAAGTPVYALNMIRGVPDIRGYFRLKELLVQWQPDLIQTWLHHADLLGGMAGRAMGVPVVWGIHFSAATHENSNWLLRVTAHLCGLFSQSVPAAVISCSNASARDHVLAGYDENRMRYVPNGVCTQRFAPNESLRAELRQELALSEKTILIGMAARFHPVKNHRLFLKAAAIFSKRYPEVEFLLCGGQINSENRELMHLVDQSRLSEKVHLLGVRKDMPAVLAALDIVTLSSDSEALPVVLAEAMSCGVPCVATDVGDCRELIGECGTVVPRGKPKALAKGWEGLLALSQVEIEALGKKSRERICEFYSMDRALDGYRAVYDEVLASGGVQGALTT